MYLFLCRSNKVHGGSGRYFKNSRSTQENESPSYRDDRSSPSGQSDQASDSTFKSRHPSGRMWTGSAASRATNKAHQSVLMQETRKVNLSNLSINLLSKNFIEKYTDMRHTVEKRCKSRDSFYRSSKY